MLPSGKKPVNKIRKIEDPYDRLRNGVVLLEWILVKLTPDLVRTANDPVGITDRLIHFWNMQGWSYETERRAIATRNAMEHSERERHVSTQEAVYCSDVVCNAAERISRFLPSVEMRFAALGERSTDGFVGATGVEQESLATEFSNDCISRGDTIPPESANARYNKDRTTENNDSRLHVEPAEYEISYEPPKLSWLAYLFVFGFGSLFFVVLALMNSNRGPEVDPPKESQKIVSHAPPESPQLVRRDEPTVTPQKAPLDRLKEPNNSTGMKMTLIPPGTFQMGSPPHEQIYKKDEHPPHTVRISRPFYLGTYEVTQREYEHVMGNNPSAFSNRGMASKSVIGLDTSRFPVERISWYDAIEYCNRLSEKENAAPYYTLADVRRHDGSITTARASVVGGMGYRLPTEAEWEYACRANATTPYHFGSVLTGNMANIHGDPYGAGTGRSLKRTTVVGSYLPNSFGLFDMHGNVWEWCQDVYRWDAYQKRSGITVDPVETSDSIPYRVYRGGSYIDASDHASAAFRGDSNVPDMNRGFRVARSTKKVIENAELRDKGRVVQAGGPAFAQKPQRRVLGIVAKKCNEGIHIVSVAAGGPATRCTDVETRERIQVEPEDHIVSVNGIEPKTLDEFLELVATSGQEMSFIIKDKRRGQHRRMTTTLD